MAAWLTEQIEFAGGPILPVGTQVELYDAIKGRSFDPDEVAAVIACKLRIEKDQEVDQTIIIYNGLLSVVPRRIVRHGTQPNQRSEHVGTQPEARGIDTYR